MKNSKEIIEWPSNLTTYLGSKGYTILKSELPIKLQIVLKELLLVKPKIIGAPVQIDKTYPVYRESDKKIYLPRYFGQEIFGIPKTIKIPEGLNINLTFNGLLRDYQQPIVDSYLSHVKNGGGGLLDIYCGAGKTDLTLYIISCLKKKTLIIVHKEFLMNQWIERIYKYYPQARIGKIQGQIIDIDDKDIVIVMLQSLSMKEYPQSLFDSFGFTIIDEVHHISSEVFSCALFKLVTKYMLGLSATMDRKDGTTHVFKMFLGDIVYKLERSKNEQVLVRGITFSIDDVEYNEIEVDFRGQTASSKMLSKICNYNRRSEFIIKVLKDTLKENEKQQIMIIASYKSILKYFYDAIQFHNIGSVGYYVGGMKEQALKISEDKQIVLATYSMAAEGLDIKTLTTLIMITPMTSIEQAVGRILRQKHECMPLIIDIIDTHSNFQRQWCKRKRFYKTQNYKIIQIDSKNYINDTSKWTTTFCPNIYKDKDNGIVCKLNKHKYNTTIHSKSSSDKSIAEETDSDEEDKDDDNEDDDNEDKEENNIKKKKIGKCLLKYKPNSKPNSNINSNSNTILY
jgi:superfamily II DNA or RNA helicase